MTGELVEATLFVAEGEEHKIIDLISSGVTAGFGSSLLSGSYVTKNRVCRVKNVKRYVDLLDFTLVSIFTLTLPSIS